MLNATLLLLTRLSLQTGTYQCQTILQLFLFSKVEFVQGSERSTWASEAEEEKGAGVNACKNEQNVCLNVFPAFDIDANHNTVPQLPRRGSLFGVRSTLHNAQIVQ